MPKNPRQKLTNQHECIFADIFEREKAIFVEQARHIISE
jgi:hypothetical protein